jgi:hypothetical protein
MAHIGILLLRNAQEQACRHTENLSLIICGKKPRTLQSVKRQFLLCMLESDNDSRAGQNAAKGLAILSNQGRLIKPFQSDDCDQCPIKVFDLFRRYETAQFS